MAPLRGETNGPTARELRLNGFCHMATYASLPEDRDVSQEAGERVRNALGFVLTFAYAHPEFFGEMVSEFRKRLKMSDLELKLMTQQQLDELLRIVG